MNVLDDYPGIDLEQFTFSVDTYNSKAREGWRLYSVFDLGHNEAYALQRYTHGKNKPNPVVELGTVDVVPLIDREKIRTAFHESNKTKSLTEGQLEMICLSYDRLCRTGIHDVLLDGTPVISGTTVYSEINDFTDITYFYDQIVSQLKYINERRQDTDKPELEELSERQLENASLLKEALPDPIPGVPYAKHCQIVCDLSFSQYPHPYLRALEFLHSGILMNKPSLALTKALLEEGMSQSEIVEYRGKDKSTVSRQVSQVVDLEQRANWQVEQTRN